MNQPLAIDLYCGLGGWSDGLIAEGYRVVGFDIERHRYRRPRAVFSQSEIDGGVEFSCDLADEWHEYPGQLVIQDVLTIHGSQLKDAAVIVASPPCQKYSWLAMPWSRSKSTKPNLDPAKALRLKWETEGPDNRLFDACFRIQREAIAATELGRCIPCEGTGHFHTFNAQMRTMTLECQDCGGSGFSHRHIPLIVENVRGAQEWVGRSTWNLGSFHLWGDVPALMPKGVAVKVQSEKGRRADVGNGCRFTSRDCGIEGVKQAAGKGDWFSKDARDGGASAKYGSKSPERKAIAAQIAKIPIALSEHIARVYKPNQAQQWG